MNQLRCADIVLLNKKDIVTDEQFAMVEQWVKETVPLASVYGSVFSKVPLPNILDVEYILFDKGQGTIQREQISTPYVLQSRVDPLLRRDENRKIATSRTEEAKNLRNERKEKHIANENFKSVVFEKDGVMCLSHFQDLLSSSEKEFGLSNSITRAKGFLSFEFDPTQRFVFQWSGRRRYQIYLDSQCVVPRTSLVFIGHSVEESTIERVSSVPGAPSAEEIQKQKEETLELIRSDKTFEILKESDKEIYFRLTGLSTTSLSKAEIDERFGLDFDKMNQDLVRSINSTAGATAFLIPGVIDNQSCVIFAIGGKVSLAKMWPIVQQQASRLVTTYYSGVQACSCGF